MPAVETRKPDKYKVLMWRSEINPKEMCIYVAEKTVPAKAAMAVVKADMPPTVAQWQAMHEKTQELRKLAAKGGK